MLCNCVVHHIYTCVVHHSIMFGEGLGHRYLCLINLKLVFPFTWFKHIFIKQLDYKNSYTNPLPFTSLLLVYFHAQYTCIFMILLQKESVGVHE